MNPFVHDLTIRRTTYDDTVGLRDEAGQPSPTETTTAVKGLVQPRSVSELDDSRSAGSQVSTHVIFLPLATDIVHADAVDWDGGRLQVTGVRRFEYGRLAHLEVDAMAVTSTYAVSGGS